MDRRRPLDSPRLLEPLGPGRRRQPEAKPDRPPARLPSLSTPRQTDDGALPPVKRGVAALSPLNAVTPDARPVGMRRHFFDEFAHALDTSNGAFFQFIATSRWFGFRMDAIVLVFLTCTVYFTLIASVNGLGISDCRV